LEFFNEGSDRLVDEIAVETTLPEVDVFVIDRLDAPRDDPTLIRHPTTKPTLSRDVDEAVHPGFRRQRQRDILVAVERTAFMIREDEPGPSVFLSFERIITVNRLGVKPRGTRLAFSVEDASPLEDRYLFVCHCSSSTLGCDSCGACSRQDSSSSAPS
jgi:hypothetical protein